MIANIEKRQTHQMRGDNGQYDVLIWELGKGELVELFVL